MAYSGVIVDKAVDAYVTPAGITRLMEGQKPKPGTGQPGAAQPGAGQPQTGNGGGSAGSPDHEPLPDASMSYESFSKFVVKVKNEDGKEGKFVLSRQGLGWKLTDIIIPME
jgi:hypothetical protein